MFSATEFPVFHELLKWFSCFIAGSARVPLKKEDTCGTDTFLRESRGNPLLMDVTELNGGKLKEIQACTSVDIEK